MKTRFKSITCEKMVQLSNHYQNNLRSISQGLNIWFDWLIGIVKKNIRFLKSFKFLPPFCLKCPDLEKVPFTGAQKLKKTRFFDRESFHTYGISQKYKYKSLIARYPLHSAQLLANHRNKLQKSHLWYAPIRTRLQSCHKWSCESAYTSSAGNQQVERHLLFTSYQGCQINL